MATDTTLPEPARMTKVQKLAALLIMLGPESAAQMLRTFDQPELEAISLEMSRLTVVSQELQQEILCEFADVAVQASTSLLGGVNYDKADLEKSVGLFRASKLIGRGAPAHVPLAA